MHKVTPLSHLPETPETVSNPELLKFMAGWVLNAGRNNTFIVTACMHVAGLLPLVIFKRYESL